MFRAVRILCCVLFTVSITTAQPPKGNSKEKKSIWKQVPELQESLERGAAPKVKSEQQQPQIADTAFDDGPNPRWIWGADNKKKYTVSTTFDAAGIKAARLKASCDNVGTVLVNGKQVAFGSEWSEAMVADVAKYLVDGENTVTARIENQGGIAAFVLKLVMRDAVGTYSYVVSSESWTVVNEGTGDVEKAASRGDYGTQPWGKVFDGATASSARVPRGVFEVLPGFQVEKLFTVPKDELGSWVCIAFDNKGRLLASDQGDKGICRITPPGTQSERKNAESVETVVERLDFSGCEYQPTGAHGMLWAFDSLYFCCNGGPGSGLYRARDTNGDDQFDECLKLKEFRGGGEHGPHSIRLSPDGKRIFVIAGNHTDPPFKAGEDLTNENYSSRIPTNWGEDLLLPRMWDANGHARGKLAPGGWIASTDPDGKTWEIWSIGYRNPYDMAFNADGELFAYDADMEWDVGTPWYRPTRVVHATSGGEFGWRSGTGKWPEYYTDSLPPLVNIGPGSPVGVDFGYGLRFPAKYQKALYICDWTFGTMYAIHTEPQESSYKAVKEEFVARSPLPLTDCAAGPDGALYFTIGGRGAQSELFRVTYVGTETSEPAQLSDSILANARAFRKVVEELHVGDVTNDTLKKTFESQTVNAPRTEEELFGDRTLVNALRLALQKKGVASGLLQGNVSDLSPRRKIQLLIILARSPFTDVAAATDYCQKTLAEIPFEALNPESQLNYLRAATLTFVRLQPPTEQLSLQLAEKLAPFFPCGDRSLDRELCQMLVYLNSPTVVSRTVALMKEEPYRDDIDMGDLLTRNAGYGRAINAMIANQPDKNQVWYAFCLRVAKVGWTPALRADYYRWFGRAQKWSGGNSFRKFLENIEAEAWQITPFDHRVLVEKAGARTPYTVPELPKPTGPGKSWSLDEVRSLAKTELKSRSYENGKKMFAATRCIVCHRFAGDGGATGPDLTQLAGRFNVDALTEAIMDPSKVISDQYKASTVLTKAGKTVSGRIVSENDTQISVLTDPEDSTKIVDLAKGEIEEIIPSKVSIMPADLLKTLNKNEVLDLLAYLLSRGDEKNGMFR